MTYNTDMFPALLWTLDALIHLGVSARNRTPIVIFAYKERDPAERSFFSLANNLRINLELASKVPGAGGHPIEIYVSS